MEAAFSLVSRYARWCHTIAAKEFLAFWRRDVPELLQMLSKTLAKAKIPTSLVQAKRFSMSDWLDAAPVLAGMTVAVVSTILLLASDRRVVPPPQARGHTEAAKKEKASVKSTENVVEVPDEDGQDMEEELVKLDMQNSYWISREALVRGMALCYFCGFVVSAVQHRALWGKLGLQPLARRKGGRPTPVFDVFAHYGLPYDDWLLELTSWIGVLLSFQMMLGRVRTMLIPALLWVLYLSIVNLQAPFTFSYGWEWLTCEVGFLVIFLCPVFSRRLASWTPPPKFVMWLIRWCAFRLLLGAGLSKVGRNSSRCWRELTCTTTHYYTQPIPNGLSWFFHHFDLDVHKVEVGLTFVEQLVLPFLMLVPLRPVRLFAGIMEMGFQFAIVATGNYAWINFIGALPCISLLDDAFFSWFLPRAWTRNVHHAADVADPTTKPPMRRFFMRSYGLTRALIHLVLLAVMVRKSVDPIKEMFGPAPWINSYDDWFLMNSQGVFGFINQHRVQIVLRYTHDDPESHLATWKHLDFKRLPGDPARFPQFLSPYHSRLDWETWIRVTASLEHLWEQRAKAAAYHDATPAFLKTLVVKILSGDDDAAGLMGTPYYELYLEGKPPKAISVDYASYTFTDRGEKKLWWRAEPVEAGAAPRVFGEDVRLRKSKVRKSPRERHWVLWFCIVGIVAAFEGIMNGCSLIGGLFRLVTSVVQAHLFALVLLSDYQDWWNMALWRFPLVELLDVAWIKSTGQGFAGRWKICYGYTHLWASACCTIGTLCLVEKLRRRRGLQFWDVLSCSAFVATAALSYALSLHD
eukprot:TRINITY_DN15833_c0_g2_i1.p1 TRINITY_DN15833_c0_g2~~TRINITY_DN15833_c0_g2_i1.p1  ORF type:complete len:803 (+),score=105.51 TRINITY_DN15833_c0_g2_i1:32-2440(+)